MTIETVQGTNLSYYLISFDENSHERTDDPNAPGGYLSSVVLDVLSRTPITDVFLMSHGWKADIREATEQYNKWVAAMAGCTADLQKIRKIRPDFRALLVGLHWPSLPFGEEDYASDQVSFNVADTEVLTEQMISRAAASVANSVRARKALETIFLAAARSIQPPHLPIEVVEAYLALNNEAGLGTTGPGGIPGDDREPFDPEQAYQNAVQDQVGVVSFGQSGFGGLLAPLQQLSFWKMKKRALQFGETGARTILRNLQREVGSDRNVRFHLMGHSFGCIVVSAALTTLCGDESTKPVESLFLVQGAMSLWSFCADIPVVPGISGYFHSIPRNRKVAGAIVTTQSEHDYALGRLYPLAAGINRQIAFAPDELPKYGAIGSFGAHGPGIDSRFLKMLPSNENYIFEKGRIHNLESSEFICEGRGLSGAHSDIAKPEVAHAFWSALMA
jgi:hypothetical protein